MEGGDLWRGGDEGVDGGFRGRRVLVGGAVGREVAEGFEVTCSGPTLLAFKGSAPAEFAARAGEGWAGLALPVPGPPPPYIPDS